MQIKIFLSKSMLQSVNPLQCVLDTAGIKVDNVLEKLYAKGYWHPQHKFYTHVPPPFDCEYETEISWVMWLENIHSFNPNFAEHIKNQRFTAHKMFTQDDI